MTLLNGDNYWHWQGNQRRSPKRKKRSIADTITDTEMTQTTREGISAEGEMTMMDTEAAGLSAELEGQSHQKTEDGEDQTENMIVRDDEIHLLSIPGPAHQSGETVLTGQDGDQHPQSSVDMDVQTESEIMIARDGATPLQASQDLRHQLLDEDLQTDENRILQVEKSMTTGAKMVGMVILVTTIEEMEIMEQTGELVIAPSTEGTEAITTDLKMIAGLAFRNLTMLKIRRPRENESWLLCNKTPQSWTWIEKSVLLPWLRRRKQIARQRIKHENNLPSMETRGPTLCLLFIERQPMED
jgi:hypothetical protein